MVNGIFNRWDSSGDSLRICDLLIRIEWNIEIDLEVSINASVFLLSIASDMLNGRAHSD